jgi:hypothetical protein
MQAKHLTISDIVARIQQLVPPGEPEPEAPQVLGKLQELTQALIQEYQVAGRLQGDPFNEAWTRPLHLYESDVRSRLSGKSVLVTGGEGFVGSRLIKTLLELGVATISSIDNARCTPGGGLQAIAGAAPNVTLYAADIRDLDALQQVFEREKPAIVFHLAAIRIPGLAEKIVWETVTSNIFGTQNIIQVCEEFGVQDCIFSSTGKASRYWTGEVYAATKKVNEWLFAQVAQTGTGQYGMVRFTHMLDNSSMCEQIESKVQASRPINIHAPDRYIVGQNVREAVHLLLNALVFSQPKNLRFILVRNLGWPTESLEVALHHIQRSGKNLPIYFQGIPAGYEESFFLGQVDWDTPTEINTLINALETDHLLNISSSGDMIISEVIPFSITTLNEQLSQLKMLCHDSPTAPAAIKQQLAEVVRQVALSSFKQASTARVLQVLRWGVNLKRYEQGDFSLIPYQPFIEVVVKSLYDRINLDALDRVRLSLDEFDRLLKALATLPSLQSEVDFMHQLLISTDSANRCSTTKVA